MSARGFLNLTVPEHAYLFGFLQGDGNLKRGTGRKGQLSIELAARDVQVLEEFQRLVPFYSSIRARTRTTNFAYNYMSAIWTLCALEAREWLEELGLPVGRKSEAVRPPEDPFSRIDYLRGLVDADGSVGMTALRLPFVSLTTASRALKDFFLAQCPDLIGRPRMARRNQRDNMFNPMATRECAVELASTMYYDGCLALDRKALAAHELRQWERPARDGRRGGSRRWTEVEDEIVRCHALDDAARILGRSLTAVYGRRRSLIATDRIVERARALRRPAMCPCS